MDPHIRTGAATTRPKAPKPAKTRSAAVNGASLRAAMMGWPCAVLSLLADASTPSRIIEPVIAGAIAATAEDVHAACERATAGAA